MTDQGASNNLSDLLAGLKVGSQRLVVRLLLIKSESGYWHLSVAGTCRKRCLAWIPAPYKMACLRYVKLPLPCTPDWLLPALQGTNQADQRAASFCSFKASWTPSTPRQQGRCRRWEQLCSLCSTFDLREPYQGHNGPIHQALRLAPSPFAFCVLTRPRRQLLVNMV